MDNTAPHPLLSHGEMLNWYRIERVLGRGGFGVIYLATDTNLDHQVAIKEYRVLDSAGSYQTQVDPAAEKAKAGEGVQRFISEARNLVRFKHPNIVRVMSVFELNNTAYIVMEFEEGIDFREYLQNDQNRRESALKTLLVPIADGLAQVHKSGFIHRDIKPANILVRTDGTPVLLDFGSARSSHSAHTEPLTALVSAGYAPLEQYSGGSEREQGPWTDIYALGAVLYFAVTGLEPVDSAKRGSAMLNGGQDPLLKARMVGQGQYSPTFLSAIDWALQFRISERPQSLSVWLEALLRIPSAQGATRKVESSEIASAETSLNDIDAVDNEFSMEDQPAPKEIQAARAKRRVKAGSKWWKTILLLIAGSVATAGAGFFLSGGNFRLPLIQEFLSDGSGSEVATPATNVDPNATAGENAVLMSELEEARGQAKALAAELAQEQLRLQEREDAQEAQKQQQAEADAAREATLKAAAAAKQARELEQRRSLTRHLDSASKSLAQGDFDVAEASLDKASLLNSQDERLIQLRARLRIALELSRAPVSDQDFDEVIAQFDSLRRAIQNKNVDAVNLLTISSIQNALFTQLMAKFAKLDLSIHGIRLNNADKSISAVLRIDRMVRTNGDLATPSDAYRERRLTSKRVGRQWSRIEW